MIHPNLELINNMKKAVILGQEVLNHYYGQVLQVEHKYKAGLVTQADRESESVITQALKNLGYNFNLLGEESATAESFRFLDHRAEPCWILDPLDGTTNFVHGFPVFAISLALYQEGQILAGLVQAPKMGNQGETYWAVKNQGAYLNETKLKINHQHQINDSFVATGFFAEDEEQLQEQLPIFSTLVRETRAIRRAGAAAYDLALVARGTFDAFWERGLKPWDTAAGALLVTEAGGLVQSYKGQFYHPKLNSVIAGNTQLVQIIQNKIQPYLRSVTD